MSGDVLDRLRKASADVKATRRLTFLHIDQPDPEPEPGWRTRASSAPRTSSPLWSAA